MDSGIQGFVINGTTAESPTLREDEVVSIYECIRSETNHAVPLILGVGSSSTAETLKKLAAAKKLKPDAALVVVPYYNKPPQRGLIEHFRAVAKATKLPVILYNVPGRTVISLDAESIAVLSRIRNIIGIKEASGRMDLLQDIIARVGPKFLLSSGDDSSCIDFASQGGHGVVSVISHVIPRELVDLMSRAREKDAKALVDYKKYEKLNALLGVESNPIPVKMAVHQMGLIDSPELRLPLVTLAKKYQAPLKEELLRLGVL
jgi:4-hydroxy-tetrahydrodipicolinate synthase